MQMTPAATANKIWSNSGDSHFIEPADLWQTSLPAHLAELMPRSEKDADGTHETVFVDGQSFRRRLPTISPTSWRKWSGAFLIPAWCRRVMNWSPS